MAGRLDGAYWLIGPGSDSLAEGCRCAFLLQAWAGAYRGSRPPTACYYHSSLLLECSLSRLVLEYGIVLGFSVATEMREVMNGCRKHGQIIRRNYNVSFSDPALETCLHVIGLGRNTSCTPRFASMCGGLRFKIVGYA